MSICHFLRNFQKGVISGRVLRRQISKIDVFEEFWLFLKNVNFCQFLSVFDKNVIFPKSGHFRPGFEEANFKNRRFLKIVIFSKNWFFWPPYFIKTLTRLRDLTLMTNCAHNLHNLTTPSFFMFFTRFFTLNQRYEKVILVRKWHVYDTM